MKLLAGLALVGAAAMAMPAAAQPKVYRCETNGKVAYSDAPCVGARVIDATPTQGVDKMAGRSRKGREVRRDEFGRMLDDATRPLHGMSHEAMNVMRRRTHHSPQDRTQCALLDARLPGLEAQAARATGAAQPQADVDLYKARRRFFDLRC